MKIFLSVDFDADAAEQYYYRDKLVKISKARFSVKVGLRRLLALLKKYHIRTTFFIPGWTARTYPNLIWEIIRDKHELALHGYHHEKLDELKYEEEYEVHRKALDCLKHFQGEIYGFRRPYWEISRNTFHILSKLKILYDSSLSDSDEPYVFEVNNHKIVELPVYDLFDDWILFEIDHRSPQEILRMWIYELEAELSYFCIIVHPACIGRVGRIKMLEEFIKYALKRKCKFVAGRDIALNVLEKH